MTIGVLTRIPSGTIFDKIGTKKFNLALKRQIIKNKQVSASHVTFQIETTIYLSKRIYLLCTF